MIFNNLYNNQLLSMAAPNQFWLAVFLCRIETVLVPHNSSTISDDRLLDIIPLKGKPNPSIKEVRRIRCVLR